MATLNRAVLVHDEDHAPEVFQPGDDLPDWAVEAITNEKVWDEGDDDATEPDDDGPQRPAKSAPKAAWQDYADELGVDYEDDATKEQIIAAVDAA